MSRETQKVFPIMTNKTTTGAGTAMDVESYRHIVLAIDTVSSFAGTIQVAGSLAEVAPTWTSGAAFSNQWAYVQIINLQDESTVNGATGIVATGTDIHNMYEVNTNGIKWLNVIITAISAGGVYVGGKTFNDND